MFLSTFSETKFNCIETQALIYDLHKFESIEKQLEIYFLAEDL